jgi:hypothetical protein
MVCGFTGFTAQKLLKIEKFSNLFFQIFPDPKKRHFPTQFVWFYQTLGVVIPLKNNLFPP